VLLDLLVPRRCAACGRLGATICARCLSELPRLRGPGCARCGAPTAWPVARCLECGGRRLAFASARSAVAYRGLVRPVVGAWKEHGLRRLAEEAADVVTTTVERPNVAALAFVPADGDRSVRRGHHPAERLARELAARWELPAMRALGRARAPRPQRGLTLVERRRNVAGAFVALSDVPMRIGLVDDVYTTGSTASAASSALRRAGARHVAVVTFARAVRQ
jgi:predicted amidophosphoribosyltransferase